MINRSVQQNEIVRRGADSDLIDAVDRTLAILECFSSERPDLGISEISRELGMHKSAVFRSLATLEARGLVEKNPSTRRYSVGANILRPAGAYLSAVGLHERARPQMERLMAATRETVSLYVPAGDRCVCIDRVESPLEVRRVIRVGDQVPLHAGSSGKVVLAHTEEPLRQELLDRLEPVLAGWSGPDREELEEQLAAIRQAGVAISRGERVPGVYSASAPVFDAVGRVAAALTVSGPAARFETARLEQYAVMVREAAAGISRQLGHGLYGR